MLLRQHKYLVAIVEPYKIGREPPRRDSSSGCKFFYYLIFAMNICDGGASTLQEKICTNSQLCHLKELLLLGLFINSTSNYWLLIFEGQEFSTFYRKQNINILCPSKVSNLCDTLIHLTNCIHYLNSSKCGLSSRCKHSISSLQRTQFENPRKKKCHLIVQLQCHWHHKTLLNAGDLD